MSTETITALPLNKRDYLSLSLLTPGVVPAQQGSIVAFFRGAVQVNGAPEEANNFMLDGVANKDNMIQGIVLAALLDAIQEFKIQLEHVLRGVRGTAGARRSTSLRSRARTSSAGACSSSTAMRSWTRGTSLRRRIGRSRSSRWTSSAAASADR